ncbi:MAG: type II toxin-antitoxin system RelE family toxin [Candidatus Bathyarchaeales archaeon]
MPKYKITIHRRIQKFIKELKNENIKNALIQALTKLENYPIILREMDIEKIKGLERAFRIRIGKYRIIFYVDKTEKTIYVTRVETRKKAYKRLD